MRRWQTEKKVNVIYITIIKILELRQLLPTPTCKISRKIASSSNNRWVNSNWVLDYNNYFWEVKGVMGVFEGYCLYEVTVVIGAGKRKIMWS